VLRLTLTARDEFSWSGSPQVVARRQEFSKDVERSQLKPKRSVATHTIVEAQVQLTLRFDGDSTASFRPEARTASYRLCVIHFDQRPGPLLFPTTSVREDQGLAANVTCT
jgi:hypothetical protein